MVKQIATIFALTITLSGCATVADYYDSSDPCQTRQISEHTGKRLKPEGYTINDIPKWCSSGSRTQRAQIYDRVGRRIGEIRY